jgi:hypothetical protein
MKEIFCVPFPDLNPRRPQLEIKFHANGRAREVDDVADFRDTGDEHEHSFEVETEAECGTVRSTRMPYISNFRHTTPWSSMASATLTKPAMLAPMTRLPG